MEALNCTVKLSNEEAGTCATNMEKANRNLKIRHNFSADVRQTVRSQPLTLLPHRVILRIHMNILETYSQMLSSILLSMINFTRWTNKQHFR